MAAGDTIKVSYDKEKDLIVMTTPGGITIKGINELEHQGFSSAIINAIKASK